MSKTSSGGHPLLQKAGTGFGHGQRHWCTPAALTKPIKAFSAAEGCPFSG